VGAARSTSARRRRTAPVWPGFLEWTCPAIALTYIFGIGRTRSLQTLEATGVNGDTRVSNLTDEELMKLRDWIDATYQVEGDLRREVQADIRRKVEIGCYQGIRHRRGLPVHGQRTQTNARTRKGKKKTVAGKKKAGKK
jgi:small subunit ribosomal protein S13